MLFFLPIFTYDGRDDGQWTVSSTVLVKFDSKRQVHHSVGQVTGINEDLELDCKFLKPGERGEFFWPETEVSKAIDYSDVEKVLQPPKKLKKKGGPLRFSFLFAKFLLKLLSGSRPFLLLS